MIQQHPGSHDITSAITRDYINIHTLVTGMSCYPQDYDVDKMLLYCNIMAAYYKCTWHCVMGDT